MAKPKASLQLKWSDEKRLYLIAKIADEILSQENFDLIDTTNNIQRIFFLADKSNEFLEKSKDNYKDVL